MDFIQFVVVFIGSYFLFNYIFKLFFNTDFNNNVKCELHNWEYGPDGFMRCKTCKKKALDD